MFMYLYIVINKISGRNNYINTVQILITQIIIYDYQ